MDIRNPNPTQAAGVLRGYLKTQGIDLQHTKALEAVARMCGHSNWQSMRARLVQDNAEPPLLRQQSASEYRFVGKKSERVWIEINGVSIYAGRADEGVFVDLFPKGCEADNAAASTYLLFEDALAARAEQEDVDLDSVAEWVGLHYGRNFDAEPTEKRMEWLERYLEAHADTNEAPRIDQNSSAVATAPVPAVTSDVSWEAVDAAIRFMDELLASVETLDGVRETHGVPTLVDLLYLHSAILKGQAIDSFEGSSKVLELVNALPSAAEWRSYIRRCAD